MLWMLAQRRGRFGLPDLLFHDVHLVSFTDLATMQANQSGGDGLIKLSHFLKTVLWTVEALLDKISLLGICPGVSAEHVVMVSELKCMRAPW